MQFGTKADNSKSETEKKMKIKYYVVNQNNYKSDRESDASTDQNEIDNNSNDDDDYDETIKKKRNKQKFIKKVKQPTNNQRKRK